ncbi:MAG: hypothetical protein M3N10_10080 [Actinomycetota bacterium]|nr:hypothetical protein [Actinomycetota bacterium]HZY64813.1 hypothetical protein [Rubrobacteraceae bacterium]
MSKEPARYGIDETIRIPITLEDEVGLAHVRAVFWRVKQGGSIGPRGLAPNNTLELRGNGEQKKRATVSTSLKVSDQHVPGEYLCVAIQVYDPQGNMTVIRNPSPPMSVLIVENGKKGRQGPRFLGWGDASSD